MMNTIRNILGNIIIFFDVITRGKPQQRSENDQRDVDRRSKGLSLYQFRACPFCVKVRRALHHLNVKIELRDAKTEEFGKELLEQGGKRKVPCLRIEDDGVQWMYNSKDVIAYLQSSFK